MIIQLTDSTDSLCSWKKRSINGVTINRKPFIIKSKDNTISGVDWEIMNIVTTKLNLRLDFTWYKAYQDIINAVSTVNQ